MGELENQLGSLPKGRQTQARPGVRDRETERKRWCSWTCSSTTAADDGCTRRITASTSAGTRRGHHLVLLSTLCWVSRIAISRTSTWSTSLLLRGRGSSLPT